LFYFIQDVTLQVIVSVIWKVAREDFAGFYLYHKVKVILQDEVLFELLYDIVFPFIVVVLLRLGAI
jgi:hypothetical protein